MQRSKVKGNILFLCHSYRWASSSNLYHEFAPLKKLLASFYYKILWLSWGYFFLGKKLVDQSFNMYWKSAVWRTYQTSKNKFLFIGHNIMHMFDSLMHHLLFNWLHNRAFADVDALLTVECVQAVMCIIRYRSYSVKAIHEKWAQWSHMVWTCRAVFSHQDSYGPPYLSLLRPPLVHKSWDASCFFIRH